MLLIENDVHTKITINQIFLLFGRSDGESDSIFKIREEKISLFELWFSTIRLKSYDFLFHSITLVEFEVIAATRVSRVASYAIENSAVVENRKIYIFSIYYHLIGIGAEHDQRE